MWTRRPRPSYCNSSFQGCHRILCSCTWRCPAALDARHPGSSSSNNSSSGYSSGSGCCSGSCACPTS